MLDPDDNSAFGRLTATWHTRRVALQRHLEIEPDAERSWLWRLHLRICTYLLRRYGNLERPAGMPPEPTPPEPAAELGELSTTPCPRVAELPADQLSHRSGSRSRFCRLLEGHASIGEHVREEAAAAAERERRSTLRSDRLVHLLAGLIFVVAPALALLPLWAALRNAGALVSSFITIAAGVLGLVIALLVSTRQTRLHARSRSSSSATTPNVGQSMGGAASGLGVGPRSVGGGLASHRPPIDRSPDASGVTRRQRSVVARTLFWLIASGLLAYALLIVTLERLAHEDYVRISAGEVAAGADDTFVDVWCRTTRRVRSGMALDRSRVCEARATWMRTGDDALVVRVLVPDPATPNGSAVTSGKVRPVPAMRLEIATLVRTDSGFVYAESGNPPVWCDLTAAQVAHVWRSNVPESLIAKMVATAKAARWTPLPPRGPRQLRFPAIRVRAAGHFEASSPSGDDGADAQTDTDAVPDTDS
ncbi:MAG: hypothetical protein HKN62_16900 [Phycisphaerales bacterium]|nr:hypothetical protein [Phycisphaerales bacterium]